MAEVDDQAITIALAFFMGKCESDEAWRQMRVLREAVTELRYWRRFLRFLARTRRG